MNPPKLKIPQIVVENVNLTTKEREVRKKNTKQLYRFYEMTIPVFSLDGQKAYLELNYYCGRLCGGGTSIYLKKVGGKWKIIYRIRTWIS